MKQIVCFGDSNTYGLIPGTTDRYDWNTRWTGIVGEEMSRQGYLVQEEGLCGRTTIFDDPSFHLKFHKNEYRFLKLYLFLQRPDRKHRVPHR